MSTDKKEVWLRGPLPGITPMLQPVAHALMQAKEEVNVLMADFKQEYLWTRAAGLASVAFHLQHMAGVLSRLFTYAAAQQLSEAQMEYLKSEGVEDSVVSSTVLLYQFNAAIDKALQLLHKADEATLLQVRHVGRAHLPSTTLGLYVHAAEHTMRHLGQLLVTVKLLPTLK